MLCTLSQVFGHLQTKLVVLLSHETDILIGYLFVSVKFRVYFTHEHQKRIFSQECVATRENVSC